jgi:uncharacterized protein YukE
MSFVVHPPALRTYASQLGEARQAVEAAKHYVERYGSFSPHDKGVLGLLAPRHKHLMERLTALLEHLHDLTDASSVALRNVAAHYEHADLRSETALDATYPAVPRPSASRG